MSNEIDEEYMTMERPNLKEELAAKGQSMEEYLALYNAYSNLLVQYFMTKFYLKNVDDEMIAHGTEYPAVAAEDKDLYQYAAEGYLKYFYIRNNIYIERLTDEELKYLASILASGNLELTAESERFIESTYQRVIFENTDEQLFESYINYGPDNKKFFAPVRAVVIGVRYSERGTPEEWLTNLANLQFLTNFLEYKVRKNLNVPFKVIVYDDFSVNCKKKKRP